MCNNKCFLKSYFCLILFDYGLAFKKEILGLVKYNVFDGSGRLNYDRGLTFWEPLLYKKTFYICKIAILVDCPIKPWVGEGVEDHNVS